MRAPGVLNGVLKIPLAISVTLQLSVYRDCEVLVSEQIFEDFLGKPAAQIPAEACICQEIVTHFKATFSRDGFSVGKILNINHSPLISLATFRCF
jgi:hypothetical protein